MSLFVVYAKNKIYYIEFMWGVFIGFLGPMAPVWIHHWCSCGQTFECASEREIEMKCRMHCKFCSNPPVAFDKIGIPKKATMMREQQLNDAERMRKIHN